MQKTLTKHGDSLALIIDKPILDLLNIEPTTPLEIRTNGEELIIRPVRTAEADRGEKFADALTDVNRRYPKSLKKLSE